MPAAMSAAGPITPQGVPKPRSNSRTNHLKSWMCLVSSSAKWRRARTSWPSLRSPVRTWSSTDGTMYSSTNPNRAR